MKIVPIALCLIAISVSAQTRAQDAELPADVTDLLIRRMGCNDWTARGRNDPALAGDLSRIFTALRCNEVPQDEAALRQVYQDNSVLLAALNAKWTKIVRRLPVQIERSPQQ